jgi:hypothetical protein
MRRFPGFGTRRQIDGFLKAHGVKDFTMEDFERDLADLKSLPILRLGLKSMKWR